MVIRENGTEVRETQGKFIDSRYRVISSNNLISACNFLYNRGFHREETTEENRRWSFVLRIKPSTLHKIKPRIFCRRWSCPALQRISCAFSVRKSFHLWSSQAYQGLRVEVLKSEDKKAYLQALSATKGAVLTSKLVSNKVIKIASLAVAARTPQVLPTNFDAKCRSSDPQRSRRISAQRSSPHKHHRNTWALIMRSLNEFWP